MAARFFCKAGPPASALRPLVALQPICAALRLTSGLRLYPLRATPLTRHRSSAAPTASPVLHCAFYITHLPPPPRLTHNSSPSYRLTDLLISAIRSLSSDLRPPISDIRPLISSPATLKPPLFTQLLVAPLSKILWFQSRIPSDARHHLGADLIALVKSENIIGPPLSAQNFMRSGLAFDRPADVLQSAQDKPRLARSPPAHAATVKTASSSGASSPFSTRSARIRKTRASTFDTASSRLEP